MKKRKIKKIIAGVSVVTLGITPPVSAAMSEDTSFRIEINKSEEQFDIQSYKSRGNSFIEETERIIAEKKEQERLRLLEEERIRQEEEKRRQEEEAERIAEENRINSVGVNVDFVLTKSNLLASELYEVFMFLEKPEMAKLSEIIIETESITGINAMIISGVIANESSWGTSRRAIEDKNFTGYGVYSDDSKGINHGTAYDNIVNTFKDVKKNYLTEGGIYFTGYSTYHINLNYSASEEWRITVNNIAKTIESIYHKFIKNS